MNVRFVDGCELMALAVCLCNIETREARRKKKHKPNEMKAKQKENHKRFG